MSQSAHGGNVHAVARQRRWPLRRVVDFSASINPLGPSPRVMQALTKALPQIVHYPDPDCTVLRAALSRHYGVSSDVVAVGNGSTELIHLLPETLNLRRVLIIGPTFSEYARAVQQRGGTVRLLHAERKASYTPPIQRAIGMVRRGSPRLTAVVLCNPNSPTGRMVVAGQARDLINACARTRTWIIVDETFAEYCAHCSVLGEAPLPAKVIVLRSLTKFYAIPGLRVGYVVASRAVIAAIRARQPAWSVNHLAQVAACAALGDTRHTQRSLRFMAAERIRFAAALQALPGVTVYPSDANFLLLELPDPASDVVKALQTSGILIRDCSTVPGLTSRTVRVAVRTTHQNARLIRLLQKILRRGHTHEDAHTVPSRSQHADH